MTFNVRVILASLVLAAAAPSESDALVAPTAQVGKADFFKPGLAPVTNPRGYDVTAIYFFDYQCPYCRRYTPDVERVMREDRKVRWIMRDLPNIAPKSRDAARVAIAASFQGRHDAFHHAMMRSQGRLTDQSIRAAAAAAKIDWARLQRDLKARGRAIDAQIARNEALADAAGIASTPAFIIGNRLSDGALNYKNLKLEIADARKAR